MFCSYPQKNIGIKIEKDDCHLLPPVGDMITPLFQLFRACQGGLNPFHAVKVLHQIDILRHLIQGLRLGYEENEGFLPGEPRPVDSQ